MDRITESLLKDFSKEHGIEDLSEEQRFDRLATYVTVRRHYSKTFDVGDLITAGGDDTGNRRHRHHRQRNSHYRH